MSHGVHDAAQHAGVARLGTHLAQDPDATYTHAGKAAAAGVGQGLHSARRWRIDNQVTSARAQGAIAACAATNISMQCRLLTC